jgi:thiamine biosynthesis protein ThiI
MEHCIVYYGELGLKKGNRKFFEDKLIENIKAKMKGVGFRKYYGYTVFSSDKKTDWNLLKEVPGISNFFIAEKRVKKDITELKNSVLDFARGFDFETFSIDCVRHDKKFDLDSKEVENILGDLIRKNLNKKVKLKSPDLTIFVKVCENGIYIGDKEFKGIGGLPLGVSGKVLCLISGGIDSPVAAFLAMKRGLKVNFIHFKPKLALSYQGEDKIEEIVKELSKFQGKTELIVVDFSKVQDEIIMKVPSKYRMLIYRRFMIRIAEKFSRNLILGDSIAQVASQTLENLGAVYSVNNGLILHPLIGLNKDEIVKIAREIGTYNISIKEYPDCCSYFVPEHPELRASSELLDKVESELKIDELVELGYKNSKVIKI